MSEASDRLEAARRDLAAAEREAGNAADALRNAEHGIIHGGIAPGGLAGLSELAAGHARAARAHGEAILVGLGGIANAEGHDAIDSGEPMRLLMESGGHAKAAEESAARVARIAADPVAWLLAEARRHRAAAESQAERAEHVGDEFAAYLSARRVVRAAAMTALMGEAVARHAPASNEARIAAEHARAAREAEERAAPRLPPGLADELRADQRGKAGA